MILYALACEKGHEFESWFPSASSYDEQAARGLVTCPVCGSAKVEKALMAPALARKSNRAAAGPSAEAVTPQGDAPQGQGKAAEPPRPVAVLSEQEKALRAMFRAMRQHVVKTADYVGTGFADEARRMHYGEIDHRSIYGETDPTEAQALREEGIEVHPLPSLPEDRN